MENDFKKKYSINKPKISIITAVYNGAVTIEDSIMSVLNQTYENIEYIIIDGGSADESVDIIKKYEPQFYGKLKWVSEKDYGIYDAWNKGISISTGEWISFLGSDDIFYPNAIELFVSKIESNHMLNFISSKILLVETDLKPIGSKGEKWSVNMKSYCEIAHVGSLHHKSLFDIKGLFDISYKITGDYEFLLRAYDLIIPDYLPVDTVMVRTGGISQSNIFDVARETLRAKQENKALSVLHCHFDFWVSILKFKMRLFKLGS